MNRMLTLRLSQNATSVLLRCADSWLFQLDVIVVTIPSRQGTRCASLSAVVCVAMLSRTLFSERCNDESCSLLRVQRHGCLCLTPLEKPDVASLLLRVRASSLPPQTLMTAQLMGPDPAPLVFRLRRDSRPRVPLSDHTDEHYCLRRCCAPCFDATHWQSFHQLHVWRCVGYFV